ncbi:MAG: SRPBCC family protein [Gemmatimonadales bacterium]
MGAKDFLSGAAVGAGLVYFLDPERGAARRARARDGLNEPVTVRRYGSRLDDIGGLEAANLSRRAQHPRSLAELLLALTGGALSLYGLSRRGAVGSATRTVGAGLLAGGLRRRRSDASPPRAERRRTIDIQKTLFIEAPVEQVYAFWTNYENFPLFMSNVRTVADLGGGRSHWVVSGPVGVPVEWNAVMTQDTPNEAIAWRSEPGSTLENAGVIRFRSEGTGTRVDFRLCYNPPGGGAGAAVAELFGADPRAKLNEDLGRMKALLESTVRSDTHGQEPGS